MTVSRGFTSFHLRVVTLMGIWGRYRRCLSLPLAVSRLTSWYMIRACKALSRSSWLLPVFLLVISFVGARSKVLYFQGVRNLGYGPRHLTFHPSGIVIFFLISRSGSQRFPFHFVFDDVSWSTSGLRVLGFPAVHLQFPFRRRSCYMVSIRLRWREPSIFLMGFFWYFWCHEFISQEGGSDSFDSGKKRRFVL